MSDKRCQETQTKLHALRAGELGRLERSAVEAHLAGCQSCIAELWLQTELEDAAKRGPAPLSDAKKHELFVGIQRQLLGVPTPMVRPAPAWPRLWLPALAATIAIVATIGILTLDRAPNPEIPPTVARGWLTREADVQAFATTATQAEFTRTAERPLLRLMSGALVVRFERQAGSEPLEVRTPDLEIIVRGTVFSVSVEGDRTTVSVQHGTVEVVSRSGERVLVTSGESTETSAGGFLRQPATAAQERQMADVFGETSPPPETALAAAPAPSPLAHPTPAALPKSSGTTSTPPPAPVPEPVELARARWRRGDSAGAVAELGALLGQADLTPRRREEALYLVATIQRELGQYHEAAVAFADLMRSDAATPTVRLARLERARILAQHLGAKPEALAELTLLAADGAQDAVADAAAFERCAILIEQRELAPARTCLNGYLERFENGSHVGECAILLDRLSSLRAKASRP